MESSHAAHELEMSGLFRPRYKVLAKSNPDAAASLLRRIKDKQGGTTGVVLTLSSLSSRNQGREFFYGLLDCLEFPEGMRR